MKYFYSPSSKGFFIDSIHKNIPGDAIELTEDRYTELSNCEPSQEIAYINGHVVLIERDLSITWDMIRTQRDRLISKTDWSQLDDIPVEIKDKYKEYRQALRDVPQSFSSPALVVWPDMAQFGISV